MSDKVPSLITLQSDLGVTFLDSDLLAQAVTHSSYSNEHPGVPDNERLEFLGDAILGAVVSDMLWKRYPTCHEGELTRYKAILVQEQGLVPIAESLGLSEYLRLGKGEDLTGGRDKPSVLSDAVEAVVAAVYLDQGFPIVRQVIHRWYEGRIDKVHRKALHADFKTKLQEWAQAVHKVTPSYEILSTEGPAHARQYTARVQLKGRELGLGIGRSKKLAEQAAARAAFDIIEGYDTDVANQ